MYMLSREQRRDLEGKTRNIHGLPLYEDGGRAQENDFLIGTTPHEAPFGPADA